MCGVVEVVEFDPELEAEIDAILAEDGGDR